MLDVFVLGKTNTVSLLQCLWSCTVQLMLTSFSCLVSSSDRAGGMLPGALPRRALTGFCPKPLRVLPLQRAGQLPVWLLRGSVPDQYGQAERGASEA